ncbi:hypothetical protein GJ496_002231 [Pomphorhynchus laevis]|nr:hypothetical protein GJ496_002231 [Pomphorhynchus laevis]
MALELSPMRQKPKNTENRWIWSLTNKCVPDSSRDTRSVSLDYLDFLQKLSRRLVRRTEDAHSFSFLMQRISAEVKQGNAACLRDYMDDPDIRNLGTYEFD